MQELKIKLFCMTEQLTYEAYLSISQNKFEVYLLNKKNLQNIYQEKICIKNHTELIDYDLLNNFLDKNIFKIEKLIGDFLKSIVVIIENKQILNLSLGIKKNYGDKIKRQYLENSLIELKDLFKENYQNNKIIHFLINNYSIDGVDYSIFDEEIEGEHMFLEVNFISIPNNLTKEISNVLEKYHIKINRFLDAKYLKNFFEEETTDLFISAYRIKSGQNQNEICLVQKSPRIKGFFERFFQFFS